MANSASKRIKHKSKPKSKSSEIKFAKRIAENNRVLDSLKD